MTYDIERIVPWIWEDDFTYEFGYTNRAFREMSKSGIRKVVVVLKPGEETVQRRQGCLWIDEWKLKRSIIEASAYCKRYGLRPIFAFECRFVALGTIYLIPKNGSALESFLEFAYMKPMCYDHFIERHRDDFLLGNDVVRYFLSSAALRPFSYKRYKAEGEMDELCDDTEKCVGKYDFWYADSLATSMRDPDYKTFVTLAEQNDVMTVLAHENWYYDDDSCIVVNDFEHVEGVVGSNGMDYLWISAKRLHDAVEIYDAEKIVDNLCFE